LTIKLYTQHVTNIVTLVVCFKIKFFNAVKVVKLNFYNNML